MADQSPLTSTTTNALRAKLDGIVSQMVSAGESDDAVQAVVNDFKQKYMGVSAKDYNGPSMGQTALDVAKQTPQMLGRVVSNLVMAPINLGKTALEGVVNTGTLEGGIGNVAHKMVIDPAVAEARKVAANLRQGRYSEAGGHAIAAAIPGLGPAVSGGAEKLGTGDPTEMAKGVADLGSIALAPAATRMAGRLVQGAGNALQSGGRSAFLRAAKVPDTIVKRTGTYQQTGGDLAAGEQEIANTVLERGQGAITRKNVAQLAAERRTLGRAAGRMARDPNVQIPSGPINKAMLDEVVKMAEEADPSLPSAMNRAVEMEASFGPTIPGDKAQTLRVASGQRNATRFTQLTNPQPGVSRVDMAMGRAIGDAQDAAIPGLAETNAQFAKVKPAAQAMAKARQRIGHHDPISLTQAGIGGVGSGIGFLAGGPVGAATVPAVMGLLSFLQRGGPLSRIAQTLYSTGKAGKGAGAALSSADQASLLAQLLTQSQEQAR